MSSISISISLVESQLPPGFRFHPTDDELICDYLLHKINGSDSLLLIEVDLNHCEPWDLPEKASVGGKEWYFYSQKDRKYATGIRTNRATASGYWKATGKDRAVVKKDKVVGMRKTLVFYRGRAPKGKKTDWVMHEFRVESPLSSSQLSPLKEDWVLCRVFHKDKEASERPNSNNNYDDTLMDSYITFDQTQPNAKQVPCFSIFSHNQTNLFFPFTHHHPIFTKSYLNTNSNNIIQYGSPTSESYLSELGMPNFWNTNAF